DLDVGEQLQRADACATAAYLELIGKAPAQAPPVVVLEPIQSPVTYARNSLVNAPTLTAIDPQSFPIPLVLMPPSYIGCPWLLTTAHHEVGHSIDRDFGLGAKLTGLLDNALPKTTSLPDRALWQSWVGEMAADLCAVLASGGSFVWSLAEIFDRLGIWND